MEIFRLWSTLCISESWIHDSFGKRNFCLKELLLMFKKFTDVPVMRVDASRSHTQFMHVGLPGHYCST